MGRFPSAWESLEEEDRLPLFDNRLPPMYRPYIMGEASPHFLEDELMKLPTEMPVQRPQARAGITSGWDGAVAEVIICVL